MNMKSRMTSYSAVILLFSLLICLLMPMLAQGVRPRALSAVPGEARLTTLRNRGDRLIDRRIKVMNAAINRLNKATKISAEDRDALIKDLQTNIDALNSLKAKIDAETNFDTLKSEVKSIFVDYRIFMVVLPRDRGLFSVARFNSTISKLESATAQLESAIDTLKQGGKDTSEVEGYLNTLKSDLANAKLDVAQAKSTFSSMTPEKDDQAASMVKSGIDSLKAASSDLKDAANQAQKIISWLKSVK